MPRIAEQGQRRVVHFERENEFRTLYGYSPEPSEPKESSGSTHISTPEQAAGILWPGLVQEVQFIENAKGFEPRKEWESSPNYTPGLSIAAQNAVDPLETWIFPEWVIYFLPGEAAAGARWRREITAGPGQPKPAAPTYSKNILPAPYHPKGQYDPYSGLIGSIIRTFSDER